MDPHLNISTPAPGFLLAQQRTESSFEQIPIIDLADASDPAKRREIADLIRDACVNVGFFYVKNHPIADSRVNDAIRAGAEFFELPIATKLKCVANTSHLVARSRILGENADSAGRGDLHEGFDIGWESEREGPMAGTNIWPSEADVPDFKARLLAYYQAAVQFGLSLFPLFALALDLPDNFFDDKTTTPAAIMRVLHYPPQQPTTVDDDGRVIGIGAHTDGCFTILWQDAVGGLQVQNADGKWIDAVPIPGTFVINIGDQLARWTNDVFTSTLHRVTNRSGRERYSMPLFFGTDYDVRLEPIQSCVSPDRPAKYEVVTAGDYVQSRLQESYNHAKAD
ncbi:hypothetical protein FB45DRAFT_897973 [Roridomyces roridus]|uniref:Fe2OG dioxygenase domain-containing protein n=1 Tax=Roridomyces roridus TaxID=1738132 RepID=A0AAD7CBI3_9AGAR|nr:hypothetical protein FB45DRAFT_897973 [Roridomyces roridus]